MGTYSVVDPFGFDCDYPTLFFFYIYNFFFLYIDNFFFDFIFYIFLIIFYKFYRYMGIPTFSRVSAWLYSWGRSVTSGTNPTMYLNKDSLYLTT